MYVWRKCENEKRGEDEKVQHLEMMAEYVCMEKVLKCSMWGRCEGATSGDDDAKVQHLKRMLHFHIFSTSCTFRSSPSEDDLAPKSQNSPKLSVYM